MAVSVKMSSKNQIVVPKAAREALELVPGDRLVVSVRENGVVELEKQGRDPAAELEGSLSGLADAPPWPELDGSVGETEPLGRSSPGKGE